MVALISVFLVTVAMSMAALTLANAQRVLHGDGGQESAESHAESAEKEGVQAGSVGAEGLGLIAPDFVPQPWILQSLAAQSLLHLHELGHTLHLVGRCVGHRVGFAVMSAHCCNKNVYV